MATPVSPATPGPIAHPDGGTIEGGGAGATWRQPLEGRAGHPLANRNIGILCSNPRQAEVLLLQRVVSGLGARTALVRPNLDADAALSVEHTAHVLGLLYEAVICVDLPAHTVGRLRERARIPVLADLVLPAVAVADQGVEELAELGRQILSQLAGAAV